MSLRLKFNLVLAAVLVALMAALAAFQAKPAEASEAVVAEARSYIGASYDYGSGYGYDCDEFTAAVYSAFGVGLSNSPSGQYASGVPSGGAAGDLVFFNEGGYGLSHVGIATGYGTIIHSSDYYGAVVETPISSIYGYAGAVDVY